MAFQQYPQKLGIPSGTTAQRPANPVTGDTYYDGTLGFLFIFDGTQFIPCSAPAGQPSISAADVGTGRAYGSGQITVTFTEGTTGGKAAGFTAAASSYTQTSASSPITLTVGNDGTYSVSGTAYNGFGTSPTSPSTSVAVTTVPQAPTIGTATVNGSNIDVTWTLGASNGGKNLSAITITAYIDGTASTSQTAATTSSTSHSFTGLTVGQPYTFKVKSANANGDSLESSASNSATIPVTFNAQYLVVAGGGGGGGNPIPYGAGGGGAGGYRSSVTGESSGGGASAESALSVGTGTNYTVTVGAGGSQMVNGSNSVFSTITSIGGGCGGGQGPSQPNGQTGGSGGGCRRLATPGSGTANQGYAGGLGVTWSSTETQSGGGGGAGAVGGVGVAATSAGTGGVGVTSSITGSAVFRAGGGGGGSWSGEGAGGPGGNGGGGSGGAYPSPSFTDGTANTGGGGGGTNNSSGNAGSGGSGIVILRYPSARTITVGAGLTAGVTNASVGTNERYTTITAGTGNVSWS
jgi:hypothetical protein